MTGKELRAIRRELGLSTRAFGAALGYSGTPNTISVDIRRMERGARAILPWVADRARELEDTRPRRC